MLQFGSDSDFSLVGSTGRRGSPRTVAHGDGNQLSIVMNVPPAPVRHERSLPPAPPGTMPTTTHSSSLSPALPKVHRRRMLNQETTRIKHSIQNAEAAQTARHLPAVPSLMFPSSRPTTTTSSSSQPIRSPHHQPASPVVPSAAGHRVPIFDGDLAYVRRTVDQYAAVVDHDGSLSDQPLAKPVRDLVLWEHLGRLRAVTSADRFDGSTAVLEEVLAAFEVFLRHGLGCTEASMRAASIPSVYDDVGPKTKSASSRAPRAGDSEVVDGALSMEKDLGILLYHVCKAGLLHDATLLFASAEDSQQQQQQRTLSAASSRGGGGSGDPDDDALHFRGDSAAHSGSPEGTVGYMFKPATGPTFDPGVSFAGGAPPSRRRSSVMLSSENSIADIEYCSNNVISSPAGPPAATQLPAWTIATAATTTTSTIRALPLSSMPTVDSARDTNKLLNSSPHDGTAGTVLSNIGHSSVASTFYDTIRGKDLSARHPTVQTFKRSLIQSLKETQVMAASLEDAQQQLRVAHSTIESYQRAYQAITSGGIPLKRVLKNHHASGSPSVTRPSAVSGMGDFESIASRGRSPAEDSTASPNMTTRGVSPQSQSITSLGVFGGGGGSSSLAAHYGGVDGAASTVHSHDASIYSQVRKRPSSQHQQLHQQQINATLTAAAISASSSVSAPTPLAIPTYHQHGGKQLPLELKPVALGAAEKLIDEILAQNATLIERVTALAAEKSTYTSRITYLERQVEQLNQAVTALSASNFDLAHQYKSSLYARNSNGSSTIGTSTIGFLSARQTTPTSTSLVSGADVALFSPMLLDGRSAEVVAHQSTVEIMKLLSIPYSATTSYAPSLTPVENNNGLVTPAAVGAAFVTLTAAPPSSGSQMHPQYWSPSHPASQGAGPHSGSHHPVNAPDPHQGTVNGLLDILTFPNVSLRSSTNTSAPPHQQQQQSGAFGTTSTTVRRKSATFALVDNH